MFQVLTRPSIAFRVGSFLLLVSVSIGSVFGGDWKLDVQERLETNLVFTDNRRLDQDGRSDTLIDLRPGLSLSREGARVKVDLDYELAITQSLSEDPGTDLSNILSAALASELYENVLFLDATAGANLIAVSGLSSLGSDGIYNDANSTQAYSFSVSPYTRHRLGRYADVLTRLTVDFVDTEGGAISGSGGLELDVTFSSGRHFTRLPWSVSLQETRTDREDRTDEQTSLTGQLNYQLDHKWSFFTRVGIEDNKVQTTRSDTDGLIWNVGGSWTPNPRTDLGFDFGQRYFGNTIDFDLSHRTRRTVLRADYSRTVSNARNVVFDALNFRVIEDGSPAVDPITGEPEIRTLLIPRLIDEDFVREAFGLGATISGNRTSMSLQLDWSNRTFEISGDKEDSFGVTARISRAFTPITNGTARLSWEQTEPDSGVDRSTYLVALGFSRQLGRQSSLSLDISHRQQDDSNGDSFDENRVSAGFTTHLW